MSYEVAIRITKTDIREGKRCACFECPGALAINRVFNGKVKAQVEVYYLKLWMYHQCWQFDVPTTLGLFTAKFDNEINAEIKPVTFKLLIPEDLHDLTGVGLPV